MSQLNLNNETYNYLIALTGHKFDNKDKAKLAALLYRKFDRNFNSFENIWKIIYSEFSNENLQDLIYEGEKFIIDDDTYALFWNSSSLHKMIASGEYHLVQGPGPKSPGDQRI